MDEQTTRSMIGLSRRLSALERGPIVHGKRARHYGPFLENYDDVTPSEQVSERVAELRTHLRRQHA